MLVAFDEAIILECRKVVGQDGTAKTYGKLYAGGDAIPFSTEVTVTDDIENKYHGVLDVKMGVGKNGNWASAKLVSITRNGK